MRREWSHHWESWYWWIVVGAWVGLMEIPALLNTVEDDKHHSRTLHWVSPGVAMTIWLGPPVLASIGAAVYYGWRHRPRRVLVPIKEDLRRVDRNL